MMDDIHVKRIFDSKIIEKVLKHKDVFKFICDDFTDDIEAFDLSTAAKNKSAYFVGAFVGDEIAAMFFYHPINHILFEVHSAVLPQYRGKLAVNMAKQSLKWIIDHTECKKVIGNIPEGYGAALALAKRAGLQVEGINRLSFMKNNKLLNQTILGITAGEILCQQQ